METLHILNGDATLHLFRETGIEGQLMVWREVFSEGPLEEDISSDSFWINRSNWISKNETPKDYQVKVLNELTILAKPFDVINLWFEFDLHCQINLLGVIAYLTRTTKLSATAIFLICPDSFPGKENFRGLGELRAENLNFLYHKQRVRLTDEDLKLANEVWSIYVSGDGAELEEYMMQTTSWHNLPSLKPALQAHLLRKKVNANELAYIEQVLYDIYQSGVRKKRDIYREFWQHQAIFGMGDMEIDIYLNRLKEKSLIVEE